MSARILVVDDERPIAQLVCSVLNGAGHKVKHAADSDSAFSCLKSEDFDLLLLDIELPGISGMRLLEILRKEERTASLPIILLTVLGDESHKVRGLQSGADDYLVKPFSAKELLARVEALLRRARRPAGAAEPATVLSCGSVELDLGRREAKAKGKRVKLTQMEFNLLALLVRRKGFVLSYAALSDSLSEGSKIMTSENLYAHIKNLRRQLGSEGERIETVHGVGYKFVDG